MYPADFDPDEWCLPPLEVDDDAEPPPERDRPYGGVFLGSELGSVRFARDAGFVDLGQAVVEGFAAVQPGLVEVARLGSTDFAVLTAAERVDALIVLERQRAWLDGVQQQLHLHHLQPPRPDRRPRPHHPVPRRAHQRRQPAPALRTPPTSENTQPAGKSDATPTAPQPGPAPKAGNTPPDHPNAGPRPTPPKSPV